MRQTRSRQIVRLQRLAEPYLKQKAEEEQNWKETIRGAANHAAVLAFLIRHGKPHIDEPLSAAFERCAQSPAWKDCCDEFPSLLPGYKYLPVKSPGRFEPHSSGHVSIIGERLRHVIVTTYPGADEKQKLEAALASAPPWLLWFTFSDYSAKLLNLTLPDLSEVSKFMRSKANFDIWWGLPRGAFERAPWPYGSEHEPLARADLNLLRPNMEDATRPLTRRELMHRNAALEKSEREREEAWPELIPAKLLKMTFHEMFRLRPENRDFRHARIGRPRPRS